MKLLNGKKKNEAVMLPYCGYLPIGGEIYAMECCLAVSWQKFYLKLVSKSNKRTNKFNN